MIKDLNNFNLYKAFAYHISLLRQFVSIHARSNPGGAGGKGDGDDKNPSSVHGNNVWQSLRKKRGLGTSGHGSSGHGSSGHGGWKSGGNDPDYSTKSAIVAKSTGGLRRINTATGTLSTMSSSTPPNLPRLTSAL